MRSLIAKAVVLFAHWGDSEMYKYALGVALACFIATPVLATDWSYVNKDLKDLKHDFKELKLDRTDRNTDLAKAWTAEKEGHPKAAGYFETKAAEYQKDIFADKHDINKELKELKNEVAPKGKH